VGRKDEFKAPRPIIYIGETTPSPRYFPKSVASLTSAFPQKQRVDTSTVQPDQRKVLLPLVPISQASEVYGERNRLRTPREAKSLGAHTTAAHAMTARGTTLVPKAALADEIAMVGGEE